MNRSQDWLDQAVRDLELVRLDIEHGYWEWACFTAQQSAEKAVKALLMHYGYTVWGHAITPMFRHLDRVTVPDALVARAQLLDAHYVLTRYPNGFAEGKPADYYNMAMASEAECAATEIVRFCQDHLHQPG